MTLDNNPWMHIQSLEVCKFVGIQNSTDFPNITAHYTDTNNQQQTTIFPKTAILTYDISKSANAQNIAPFGNNAGIDAFGRLRVSEPRTLFNAKLLNGKTSLVFNEVVSGAYNSAFDSNNSCVNMTVSGKNSYIIRQSKVRPNYQPGKSQLIYMTGTLDGTASGNISRMGLFTSLSAAPYNTLQGFYLENNSGNYSVNIANLPNAAISTVTVPQSAWNIDPLNGTGPSRLTIDFTKTQIFTVDFEWLGVGRVRFGFALNGLVYYVHEETHFNNLTDVYTNTPNLPIRYEIRQTGNNGGTMKQICSTVISEGGEDNHGLLFSADVGNTAVAVTNGTNACILAIRLDPSMIDNVAHLVSGIVAPKANTATRVAVYLNPQCSGPAFSWQSVNNSFMQYAVGTVANAVSAYDAQSYVTFAGKQAPISEIDLARTIRSFGSSIDGTPDVLGIAVTPLGSNEDYWCSINWSELT